MMKTPRDLSIPSPTRGVTEPIVVTPHEEKFLLLDGALSL
jgi:hypothetical protein